MHMRKVSSDLGSFQEADGLVRAVVLAFNAVEELRRFLSTHNPTSPAPDCEWVNALQDHTLAVRCRIRFLEPASLEHAEISVSSFALSDRPRQAPEFGITCQVQPLGGITPIELWIVSRGPHSVLYQYSQGSLSVDAAENHAEQAASIGAVLSEVLALEATLRGDL